MCGGELFRHLNDEGIFLEETAWYVKQQHPFNYTLTEIYF